MEIADRFNSSYINVIPKSWATNVMGDGHGPADVIGPDQRGRYTATCRMTGMSVTFDMDQLGSVESAAARLWVLASARSV